MAVEAELKGKLQGYKTEAGVRYVDAEDPLTASIFESIEVMDRGLGLGAILRQATAVEHKAEELANAKFHYWMHDKEAFGDETEPDLVITVGDTLYLIEAKYRSGLGQAKEDTPEQLKREFEGGVVLKDKCHLSRFRLICVAGDVSTLDDISRFEEETGHHVHCVRWQDIHRIMTGILGSPDIDPRDHILARRCEALLERRKMASFGGFKHLEAHEGARRLYEEVFAFANTLLYRLEEMNIVRAVHEFRIERDGGQRSLAVAGLEQWAPSYFALPVQKEGDLDIRVEREGRPGTRTYRVDRFAFFTLDIGGARVIVGKATSPSETRKSATFWDTFFRRVKKDLADDPQELDAVRVGDTEFRLQLRSFDANSPDLLDQTVQAIVNYLD